MSDEMFYMEDGKKRDAAIHNEILAEGSIPQSSSIAIAKACGLTDEECAVLFNGE